jgi:DNA (cytosine-5)-methyltransferase 1
MTKHATTHGYSVSSRLINAIEYGAAQDRERIIMLGLNAELSKRMGYTPGQVVSVDEFPWSIGRTHDRKLLDIVEWPSTSPFGEASKKPRTVPNELTVAHWFDRNGVEKHPNAKHVFTPRAGLAKFETVAEGDDSRKSYKRLHRWRYSPTACYGNNEVHLHPYRARRLTVAEALAIQSLPPEFVLPDSMSLSAMFKTVGNGVPYVAGVGLAAMIRRCVG